ncbi:hypothetical protein AVEN_32962-1 [Araneus ventricosus]|uniref:Regulatory protein zeste n=1 Tax=Araneus ventricosus TaxID=182803 RepID=A0A4Y2ING4_ARAVE|nr:hypothetical protein AVEN_32962-1 [Araneus ventricosus]
MSKTEARKNFTVFGKEVLLGEIEKHKTAVENKCTKVNANCEKTTAWIEITKRFNSTPGVNKRTMIQLQGFYQNLKRRAMKKKAEKRIDIYKTGGGPSTSHLGPTEED